jgi:hypothetical protein
VVDNAVIPSKDEYAADVLVLVLLDFVMAFVVEDRIKKEISYSLAL